MGSKAELQLARLHARTSLASLPAPRNDVTGQIPDDITEEEKELLESEAVSSYSDATSCYLYYVFIVSVIACLPKFYLRVLMLRSLV